MEKDPAIGVAGYMWLYDGVKRQGLSERGGKTGGDRPRCISAKSQTVNQVQPKDPERRRNNQRKNSEKAEDVKRRRRKKR